MSVENQLANNEIFEWHAGKTEMIGAGVSVVLLGGAYFFPETGKILPAASAAIAFVDLIFLTVKDMGTKVSADIARMVREENAWQEQ